MAGDAAKGARGVEEVKAKTSGGGDSAQAGSGKKPARHVRTEAEEHAAENLDPSSPGETGTTPGTDKVRRAG